MYYVHLYLEKVKANYNHIFKKARVVLPINST